MIRSFHRWLSLLLCVPLLWIAATGCILAVVNLWSDRHPPFRQNPRSLRESLSQVTADLTKTRAVEWQTPDILQIDNKNGERVLIDANHPEITLSAPSSSDEWLHTLMHLHRGKFLGDFGRFVFSTIGATLLFLAASGLFLLRRRNRFLNVRDFHQAGAWILTLPLGLMIVTGSLWNLSREWRALPALPQATTFDPIRALSAAEKVYPASTPQAVYFSDNRTLVLFADQSRFYWDSNAQAGDLREVWSRRGWIEPLFYLHSGRWFGRYGVLIPLLTGLGALALTITGMILFAQWWQRR
jgi:uncharacterized iron-regulated membrane protein